MAEHPYLKTLEHIRSEHNAALVELCEFFPSGTFIQWYRGERLFSGYVITATHYDRILVENANTGNRTGVCPHQVVGLGRR